MKFEEKENQELLVHFDPFLTKDVNMVSTLQKGKRMRKVWRVKQIRDSIVTSFTTNVG